MPAKQNARPKPKFAEIYILWDPRTEGVRYIGKAISARTRYLQHLREAKRLSTPLYAWIRKLQAEGVQPSYDVVMTCCIESWEAAERAFIALARIDGDPILNVADGGNQPGPHGATKHPVPAPSGEPRGPRPRSWRVRQGIGQFIRNQINKGNLTDGMRSRIKSDPRLFAKFGAEI